MKKFWVIAGVGTLAAFGLAAAAAAQAAPAQKVQATPFSALEPSTLVTVQLEDSI